MIDTSSLRFKHNKLIDATDVRMVRYIYHDLPWNDRLIAIKGTRGIGKTTLLLQRIKKEFGNSNKALYITLDDLWFTRNTLSDLAEAFVADGGTHLFIDEVHKYPNWSIEIKNLYDFYPELSIVFTGSSLLEILNSRSDLSRRALAYEMQGLSLREYINITLKKKYEPIALDDILTNGEEISRSISSEIKPLKYFGEFLVQGYFPFAGEDEMIYQRRLKEIINMTIEMELPLLRGTGISIISKMRKLLFIISESAPFTPNVSALSQKTEIARKTLLEYLHYLDEARVINTLYKEANGVSILQKPDKIFLENTNYIFALAYNPPNIGSLRETFFLNQIKARNEVTYPCTGDFLLNRKILIEVGGKNKTFDQIADVPNSYLALDNIEYAIGKKIPLWLFGFNY
ncbi:MAG: AAA family ATPase [Flavobacteriales bacterium]|nr:AAA family ATPase [Flavobacteriales bacterium]